MSTNDDPASRRGRRPEAGSQQWRAQNGQDREDRRYQSSSRDRDGAYFDPRSREAEPQQSDPRRNAYSAFSRHSYAPPRQDPPPPPPPSSQQHREPPRFYADPAPRNDGGRAYHDAGLYEQDGPALPFAEAERDDLFGREPAPLGYPPRNDGYEQPMPRQAPMQAAPARDAAGRGDDMPYLAREPGSPMDDYERNFAARIAAQESQASRFFLPEDTVPQRAMAQPSPDTGYMAQNHYSGGFEAQAGTQSYGQDAYEQAGGWGSEAHDATGIHGGLPQRVSHGDELDEDFFADEDELYQEEELSRPKKGRKKLIAAALVGAIGVGGGGMYAYKHLKLGAAGDGGTPLIRADNRPSKEVPSNPGGKQFANGEKLIYDRLGADGQTQTASLGSVGGAIPPARNTTPSSPAAGNSLEDRIEEALKKAQRSGDAPPGGGPASSNLSSSGRPDQPTVVRGETYGPDGTRVDSRPMITPTIANVNGGQLPPPFGNAPAGNSPFTSQVQAAPLPQAPFRAPPAQPVAAVKNMQPASPPPQAPQTKLALATPAAPPASGYYVQIKSSQDEKAATRELQSLNDKYSVVLGGTQLITKTVDLGDKGVWFRTMAGPLSSKEAASDLCTKLKGAGLAACLVQKSE